MGVEGSCVKDERLTGGRIRGSILIPQITMHEAGLDAAAPRLKRLQESRDDLVEDKLANDLELGPLTLLLLVELDHVGKLLAVEHSPRVFPAVGDLPQLSVACRDVKSKLASGRHGLPVHLSQALCELDWVRRLLADLTELSEQEVGGRVLVLAPRVGFGTNARRHGVDRLERFVLALHHGTGSIANVGGLKLSLQ